jgi:hypothetical protein
MRLTSVSITLLFPMSLAAQPAPHATTWPNALAGCYTNGSNAFPFARTGGLFQLVNAGEFLDGPRPITHLGARPARGVSSAAQVLSMEVVMANTTVTPLTMTKDFATNRGPTSTTVFTRKQVNLAPLTSAMDPNATPAWLANDVPFAAIGPNLLVQFDFGPASAATDRTHRSDGIYQTSSATFHTSSVGTDCGGAATTSYSQPTWTFTLNGATPNQPVIALIGVSSTRLGSSAVLPYRLDFAGMTNCFLRVDPLLVLPGIANASGGYTLGAQTTLIPGLTIAIHAQALHRTTANPAGWATSNLSTSLLGQSGMGNYVYNWTVDGPQAQYGPYPVNSQVTLLFRP